MKTRRKPPLGGLRINFDAHSFTGAVIVPRIPIDDRAFERARWCLYAPRGPVHRRIDSNQHSPVRCIMLESICASLYSYLPLASEGRFIAAESIITSHGIDRCQRACITVILQTEVKNIYVKHAPRRVTVYVRRDAGDSGGPQRKTTVGCRRAGYGGARTIVVNSWRRIIHCYTQVTRVSWLRCNVDRTDDRRGLIILNAYSERATWPCLDAAGHCGGTNREERTGRWIAARTTTTNRRRRWISYDSPALVRIRRLADICRTVETSALTDFHNMNL